MYRRQQEVLTLSDFASELINRTISRSIVRHAAANCEFCSNYDTMENCPYLKYLKTGLKELPVFTRNVIYGKIQIRRYIDYEHLRLKNGHRKLSYMFALITESSAVRLGHSIQGPEDMKFVLRFADNIDIVLFQKSKHFQLSYLEDAVKCTNTLLHLHFGRVHLTEDILKTIGKYCSVIKELNGCIQYRKYQPAILLSLLFEDPETQLKRNSCCDTLECLGGLLRGFEPNFRWCRNALEKQVSLIEALNILFTNVPNLNSIGKYGFKLEDVLFAIHFYSVTKIHKVSCSELSLESFARMRWACPELKILTVHKETEVEVSRLLHTCKSIEELNLHGIQRDSLTYEGLLAGEWLSLKILSINGTMNVLNLDVMANTLKNLEDFTVTCCMNVEWTKEFYFRSLKRFNIRHGAFKGTLTWLKCFSNTIEKICLRNDTDIRPCQVFTLVTDSYPNLECVSIKPLIFNIEFVKAVVANCPKLWDFGKFDEPSEEGIGFEKYFVENDINCHLSSSSKGNLGLQIDIGDSSSDDDESIYWSSSSYDSDLKCAKCKNRYFD